VDPTQSILSATRLLWPLGIVVSPFVMWLIARRAVELTLHQQDLHADIRRAAMVLAVLMGSSCALASLVLWVHPETSPLCLVNSPPWQLPAAYLWGTAGLALILLVGWVWLGSGARQLGVLGGALAQRTPYPERAVRWVILLYSILCPVTMLLVQSVTSPSSFCAAS
jgi:hypothetical protein